MIEFFTTPFVAFFLFVGGMFGYAPEPQLGATVLMVYQGGTGSQTFTSGECLVGAGADPITTAACAGGGSSFGGALGDLSDVATTTQATDFILVQQADGTFDLEAQTGGGGADASYAEFIQVGDNQQNVSTTPFLFAEGLLASTTVQFDLVLIYGNLDMDNGDITNYFGSACSTTNQWPTDISDAGVFNCVALDTSGAWSGNAGTATASADNPDNCNAGEYPLGVDANWDAESCTDATTEIDSAILTHKNISTAHHSPTVNTDSAYAEFTQVGDNQQNVSTTPFLFVNGLYASSTVLFDAPTIFGNLDIISGVYQIDGSQITVGSDLDDVIVNTPMINQVLSWDGTDWVNIDADIISVQGLTDFYYTTSTKSDIEPYGILLTSPSLEAEQTITRTSIANTKVLLSQFVTATGTPGVTAIPAGAFHHVDYLSVDSDAGITKVVFEVWNRTALGVETRDHQATTTEINGSLATLYETDVVRGEVMVNASDRTVVKLYIFSTQSGRNVTQYLEGTDNVSHIHTPIGVSHNSIQGLQGGSATLSQRYHLLQAEQIELNAWLDDVTLESNGDTIVPGLFATTSLMDWATVTNSLWLTGTATSTGTIDAVEFCTSGIDCIADFTGDNLSVTNGVLNAASGGSGAVAWEFNATENALSPTTTPSDIFVDGTLKGVTTTVALDVWNTTDDISNQVAIFRANDRATAQNNDQGYLSFYGDTEDAGVSEEFARITWEMDDVTSASKDSTLRFWTMTNNTMDSGMVLVGDYLTVSKQITAVEGIVSSAGFGQVSTYFRILGTSSYDSANSLKNSNRTNHFLEVAFSGNDFITVNNSAATAFIEGWWWEASSGNHPLIASMAIKPFRLLAGNATVSDTASLYIEGAAITTDVTGNNYSLWVDDIGGGGISRIDGSLGIGIANSASNGDLYVGSNATVTDSLTVLSLGAGFVQTDANGLFSSAAITDGDVPDTITVSNYVRKSTWTDHDNYPVACTNQFVRGLGDTLTCETVDTSADTNLDVGNGITLTDDTLTVVGGTALTADAGGLSVTADAIGDTQLAFNTGQHLTTTDSPTFANATITNHFTADNILFIRDNKVGIGIQNPDSVFTVSGNISMRDSGTFFINGSGDSNTYLRKNSNNVELRNGSDAYTEVKQWDGSNDVFWRLADTLLWELNNGSGNVFTIDNFGNTTTTNHFTADNTLYVKDSKVGIGTDSPDTLLHLQKANTVTLTVEDTSADGIAGVSYKNDVQEWVTRIASDDSFQIQDTSAGVSPFRILPLAPSLSLDLRSNEIVINQGGVDLNFRVEASGQANALFVQGDTGNIGLGIPNSTSTLSVAGDANIWTDLRVGGILTNSSNIKSNPKHLRFNIFNPNGVQSADSQVAIWPETDADLTITKITVTLDSASNEVLGDLKYADTFIGLASAVVINDFDTTSGVREDDSITSGSVPTGKVIYIQFDSAPDAAITQMSVDIIFDYD